MPEEPTVGVILAAGMSRRLGRPKQLVEIDGIPLVRIVATTAMESKLDHVIVVTGHQAEGIRQAVAALNLTIEHNPNYESGQASSLKIGMRAAAAIGADAIVVLLADQPGVSQETIDRLIEARRDSGAPIGMARYGEDRGHPVLFGRELFSELGDIAGDQGGREVIKRHKDRLALVDGGSAQVPMDVDTEADVEALNAGSRRRSG